MRFRRHRLIIVIAAMLVAAISASAFSVRADETLPLFNAGIFIVSAAAALGCAAALLVALVTWAIALVMRR